MVNEDASLHFTLFGNKSSSLKTKGFLHIFTNPMLVKSLPMVACEDVPLKRHLWSFLAVASKDGVSFYCASLKRRQAALIPNEAVHASYEALFRYRSTIWSISTTVPIWSTSVLRRLYKVVYFEYEAFAPLIWWENEASLFCPESRWAALQNCSAGFKFFTQLYFRKFIWNELEMVKLLWYI